MDLVYDDEQCWYCGEENITCGINATKKSGEVVELKFCSDNCRCKFIKEHKKEEKVKYLIM
jgi:hypothetical protein